jgi:hypothetical protein
LYDFIYKNHSESANPLRQRQSFGFQEGKWGVNGKRSAGLLFERDEKIPELDNGNGCTICH